MRAFVKEVPMQMQGHSLLVVGGTRGIGRGLAELLCRLGNDVLVLDGEPAPAPAAVRTGPGLRRVAVDLADPWRVAAFAAEVAATCPALDMLVNIAIAFPVRQLPGLRALLADDDTHLQAQAWQLGVRHLTGALLPHLRQRAGGSVMQVSAGPALAPPPPCRADAQAGVRACAVSVTKRWVSASIEVCDVGMPARAAPAAGEVASAGVARVEFLSRVAHLLAEGLQEDAALARLRALWPAPRPARWEELAAAA
jgi:uncharacterized oxidoreductase